MRSVREDGGEQGGVPPGAFPNLSKTARGVTPQWSHPSGPRAQDGKPTPRAMAWAEAVAV